jgi:NAD(P)-dependent dehydrogenase (short-subunit alcohol dehydrogenase family)
VLELDLASLDSVRSFATAFGERHDDLHVLVNNAGVMFMPYERTEDGFELQFGVNHLGHFALTGLLLDRLLATEGRTRVVTVSSAYHERGELTDLLAVHDEATYDRSQAYSDSKLANVLFAFELQRRLLEADHDVTSLAVHPGYAATNLQYRGPEAAGSRLRLLVMKVANTLFAQSAAQGAWPTVYGATHPGVHGGEYVGPGGLLNARGAPELQSASDRANDPDLARRLWERSTEWTGVEFGLPEQGSRRESTGPGVDGGRADTATDAAADGVTD